MTYEPLAGKDAATPQDHRLAELTAQVVDCFSKSQFKECLEALDRMEKELGESKLTHLYREYAQEYQKNGPPADFQGQIALTEK